MLNDSTAFSGFSVDDLYMAKEFYNKTLGLNIKEIPQGLVLQIAGKKGVFIYQKDDHSPATYTILNFSVENIDDVVKELKEKGVVFEQYKDMTDKDDIARGLSHNRGPDIAWFKDPAGNILSVLQEE